MKKVQITAEELKEGMVISFTHVAGRKSDKKHGKVIAETHKMVKLKCGDEVLNVRRTSLYDIKKWEKEG